MPLATFSGSFSGVANYDTWTDYGGATSPNGSRSFVDTGSGVMKMDSVGPPECVYESGNWVVRYNDGSQVLGSSTSLGTNAAGPTPGTYSLDWGGGGSLTIDTSGPDINVKGNSVDIPDGTTSTSSGDHTLFPSTEAFSTSTRTFTIQNTGSSTLTISGVTSSSNDFDILTPPSGTVSAGGSTTFVVRAKPLSPGTKGSTITISSDDPDAEASYTFNVAVVASWPDTLSFSSGCIFDLTV